MNKTLHNPTWWDTKYDSAWDRTKAALKRDWDQTKHDFGGDNLDLNQGANDTVKQAVGKSSIPPSNVPTPEEYETAYRFGYGARMHYGDRYKKFDTATENQLRTDWEDMYPEDKNTWTRHRRAVQYGYEYDK